MLSYDIMITRLNSLSFRDFSLTATWYLLKIFSRYYLEELHSLEVNANQQLLRENGLKGGTEAPTSKSSPLPGLMTLSYSPDNASSVSKQHNDPSETILQAFRKWEHCSFLLKPRTVRE